MHNRLRTSCAATPGNTSSGCVDLPGAALGKLDADLGEIYRRALQAGPRRKAFAARQAQWVRDEGGRLRGCRDVLRADLQRKAASDVA
jgi:hypothetical protein